MLVAIGYFDAVWNGRKQIRQNGTWSTLRVVSLLTMAGKELYDGILRGSFSSAFYNPIRLLDFYVKAFLNDVTLIIFSQLQFDRKLSEFQCPVIRVCSCSFQCKPNQIFLNNWRDSPTFAKGSKGRSGDCTKNVFLAHWTAVFHRQSNFWKHVHCKCFGT